MFSGSLHTQLIGIFLILILSMSFAAAQDERARTEVVDVNWQNSWMEWFPAMDHAGSWLSITGPGSFAIRQEYREGDRLWFSALDEWGNDLPDGEYKWELTVPPTAGRDGNSVETGRFWIERGVIRKEAPIEAVSESDYLGLGLGKMAGSGGWGGDFPFSVESAGNNFFGTGAGDSITTGHHNSYFGANTGYGTTEGYYNAFFGAYAGDNNTTGNSNAFFGVGAGFFTATGNENAFFGRDAGYSNTASMNSFFGESSGEFNSTGHDNSFFGWEAGVANTSGNNNSFFGESSGRANTTGAENSFFGENAGGLNTTGNWNTFIGADAGFYNSVGTGNTFVGALTKMPDGLFNATALGLQAQVDQSNALVLGSVAGVNAASTSVNVGIGTTAPQRQLHLRGNNAVFRMDRSVNSAAFMLVRTDASWNPLKTYVVGVDAFGTNNGRFVINDLGAATGGGGLNVLTIDNNRDATFTGSVSAMGFFTPSSLRFKSNIRTIENPLETVKQLRGVSFNWNETGAPSVGLVAEEVAEVLPELVSYEADGTTTSGVDYTSLVAVLVEASKVQQEEIETLRKQNEALSSRLQRIEKELRDR